ncbi:MAG: diacylglycerol/lipid kinase family protein [Candidatus Hodarchaeota archaeon]
MDYHFIINPKSSKGATEKVWEEKLQPILKSKEIEYDSVFTEHSMHALELARAAAEDGGYKNIITVGGDGTNNETVNGVLDEKGQLINKDITLGLICSGTGSDFIKTMEIPRDPVEALDLVLKGNTQTIDVMKGRFQSLDGSEELERFSINVADAALGGEVVERVNNIKKSRLGGKLLFMLVELRTLMGYKLKPSRVQIDGGDWIDLELIAIFYGNCKFNGGGLRAATRAIPDDGLIDVFYVENIKSNFKLIINLAKLYGSNEAAEKLMKKFEDYTYYGRCKTSRLEPREGSLDILIDFDGELVGKAPLDIEIIPSAVKYFSP